MRDCNGSRYIIGCNICRWLPWAKGLDFGQRVRKEGRAKNWGFSQKAMKAKEKEEKTKTHSTTTTILWLWERSSTIHNKERRRREACPAWYSNPWGHNSYKRLCTVCGSSHLWAVIFVVAIKNDSIQWFRSGTNWSTSYRRIHDSDHASFFVPRVLANTGCPEGMGNFQSLSHNLFWGFKVRKWPGLCIGIHWSDLIFCPLSHKEEEGGIWATLNGVLRLWQEAEGRPPSNSQDQHLVHT